MAMETQTETWRGGGGEAGPGGGGADRLPHGDRGREGVPRRALLYAPPVRAPRPAVRPARAPRPRGHPRVDVDRMTRALRSTTYLHGPEIDANRPARGP